MAGITRTCPGCSEEQAISRKFCNYCGENLRKRENADVRKQELGEKFRKTSFHYLKTALKKKVDILQAKDCEIVVIGYHRNQERSNFWSYSPKGSLGEKFLQHDFGDYVLQLFHEYIKDPNNNAYHLSKVPATTALSHSEAPVTTASSASRAPVTTASSASRAPVTTASSASRAPVTTASSASRAPVTTASSASRVLASATSAAQGVSYLVNGKPVVVGQIVEGRDTLHGHIYPDDHICLLVLAAEKGTSAPFVIDSSIEE